MTSLPLPSPAPADLGWCFSTLGCPELDLPAIARLARRHGIFQVELRTLSERTDLPNLFAAEYGTPSVLRAWLAQQGLRVVALDSSAKLIGCPPDARQELLDFARWAQGLGVPALRVFDGGAFQPRLADRDRGEALDFLHWWADEKRAHRWQVDLIVETHDALCNAAACLDLAEAAEGGLHLLWDAHHTWRKGGEDPLHTWQAIRPHVRHIHFKDSIGRPSARHPFTYTPLGEGEFALQPLLDQIRHDRFTGPVSLEWERKWHPYLAPLDDALTQLAPYRGVALGSRA
jgi:sugar phosphate isomerase/epimerase